MSERTESIQQLYDQAEGIVKTQLSIYKLQAVAKTATVSASVASSLFLGVAGMMFLLFLSLGLAFWLGDLLSSIALGFTVVAGIYLLVGIVIYSLRKTTLKRIISDRVVNELLNDKENESEKNQ